MWENLFMPKKFVKSCAMKKRGLYPKILNKHKKIAVKIC